MHKFLSFVTVLTAFLFYRAGAQDNQTVINGHTTTAVNFSAACNYNWLNDNPAIGLPASGTGNIPAFTAINTSTISVTATITATPVSTTGFAYISNWGDGTVSCINTENNTVIATIPVGENPFGIYVSHDNQRAYVANIIGNSVSVINIAQNVVEATINLNTPFNAPYSLCLSPDDSRLYIVNNQGQSVTVVNTATNAILTTIPVSVSPYAAAISPDGSRLYVAHNIMANSIISVINTANNEIITTIPVPVAPEGVVISPDGHTLYCTGVGTSSVTAINTTNNTVIKQIAVGNSPEGIAITPDGSKVYSANFSSNNVTVINTAANTVAATIAVGAGPVGLSANQQYLYVANESDNNVSVIDVSSNTVIKTVPVGLTPNVQGNFVTVSSSCSPVTFKITVDPSLESTPASTPSIPNTFTPNNDGINDTWYIGFLANYPNCLVKVFNRWGQQLYSSVGYTRPWNGQYNGSILPSATYYYTIDLKNGQPVFSGSVTIIH